MALATLHPIQEVTVHCHSASIGASPAVAALRVPFRGQVIKVGCVTAGSITTGDCSVAVSVNGTTMSGSPFTIPVSGAATGQVATALPTAITSCNEDDFITFTPSGASGSSIPGTFFAVITRNV